MSDIVKIDCPKKNRFALLRVCRQMYAEAALLPFSLNTFCLRPQSVEHFLHRCLKPAQRNAITSLRLPFVISPQFAGHIYERINMRLLQLTPESVAFAGKLEGLRAITVSMNITAWNKDLFRQPSSVPVIEHQKHVLRKWLEDGNARHVKIVLEEPMYTGKGIYRAI
ncbi:hypothetical protein ACEQ8H_008786 [Pleosporales sp. CAS-2024a]